MRTLNDSEIEAVAGAKLVIMGDIQGNDGVTGIGIGAPGSGGKNGGNGVGVVIGGRPQDNNCNSKWASRWPFI